MRRSAPKVLSAIIPAVSLGLLLLVQVSFAQGGSGGQNKGGNNGPSPQSNNQGSQQPSQNNQGPSTPGITGGGGGTMAIESVLFAYKALAEDAEKIAGSVRNNVTGKIVVIATPADFANLVQWRATMYQAKLLDDRAVSAIHSLTAINIPVSFDNVQKNVPKLGGPFIASPADVQALIQTLASIFAVNESLSASSGSLTTTPLTNLLAGQLRHAGSAVYVPSVYAPSLLRREDLQETFIGVRLQQLEADRQNAVIESQRYSQALADAQTILSTAAAQTSLSITSVSPTSGPPGTEVTIKGTNFGAAQLGSTVTFNGTAATVVTNWSPTTIVVKAPTPPPGGNITGNVVVTVGGKTSIGVNFTQAAAPGPPVAAAAPPKSYSADQIRDAADFMNSHQQTINLKVTALSSIVAAIDTFESSLLTGQTAPPTTSNQGNGQQSPNTGTPPGGPAASPAPPVQNNNNGGNPTGGNTANAPTPSTPNTTGSPLQQILPSDLLAHQIWNGAEVPADAQLDTLRILVVQTLESGGNQLTKSNLFLGSRIYFNGGAVATFGLYEIDGNLECGGFAYAYGGYAKDDDFRKAMAVFKTHPVGEIESSCRQ
jgi:hypothetical protein